MLVGGNFLTMHNEDAISVCPFYMSRADIKPSKWIPPWYAASLSATDMGFELHDV
jgi:hypothetical protein